jgi:hypothetical protein
MRWWGGDGEVMGLWDSIRRLETLVCSRRFV